MPGDAGPLTRDANGQALQVATGCVFADASGTPKLSPLSYSSAAITLVVPVGAIQLLVGPTTDMRFSTDPALAAYDVITAGTRDVIGVAGLAKVYIARDSADGSLRFRFTTV